MISNLQAIFLGLLQGLTEFLPVSSSGHLVLGQRLMGFREPELLFDVAVHVGTLVAVVIYFRSDLWTMARGLWAKDQNARQGRKLIYLVAAGSIPTALLGLLCKDLFERMFSSLWAVGAALLLTAAFLFLTRLAPEKGRGLEHAGVARAFGVGVAQGLAITPGLSRSGSTIAAGLLLGLDRELAARLSFVMSIPAILGALVLQLAHVGSLSRLQPGPYLVGGLTAAVSGYLALRWLLRLVQQGKLYYFSPYCALVGLAALAWAAMG